MDRTQPTFCPPAFVCLTAYCLSFQHKFILGIVATSMASVSPLWGASVDDDPYIRIHFDHLLPKYFEPFTRARKNWIAFVAARQISDPWNGTIIEVGGRGFYTLRPFTTLMELEATQSSRPTDTEYEAAVRQYNMRSDELLIFPHTTQIVACVTDVSYTPADGAKLSGPCVGLIAFDSVEPLQYSAYADACTAIH